MKIAVIGATGYVGNAVVQELAGRGHEVTAFARNTDKVSKRKMLPQSPQMSTQQILPTNWPVLMP